MSNKWCVPVYFCVCFLVTKLCPALFATLWTVTRQPPLSIGFFKQEYWSGLPFPSPGLTQESNSCILHGRWILYLWATRVACLYNTHIHLSLSLSVSLSPSIYIYIYRERERDMKWYSKFFYHQQGTDTNQAGYIFIFCLKPLPSKKICRNGLEKGRRKHSKIICQQARTEGAGLKRDFCLSICISSQSHWEKNQ